MTKIYCKALHKELNIKRIIGEIDQGHEGPCLIFFGGIHGNEPTGVFALHQVISELNEKGIQLNGSLIAIAGNLWALERSERFQEVDLNRLWTDEQIRAIQESTFKPKNEDEKQQLEIFQLIEDLRSKRKGPFFFFDLHTTSSQTIPFLTVNDSLLNRKFTKQYPAPIILGIEEYIEGPLLSYINQLGYISFGFEAGQHDDKASVDNHRAFIYLSLVFSGSIEQSTIDFSHHFNQLGSLTKNFYEIFYRYKINESEDFLMEPGFTNFQKVSKDQVLAKSNGKSIITEWESNIFMPLYQSKGDDGFFLARKIPKVFLALSKLLRNIHFDKILPLLPGIQRSKNQKDTLILNRRIARLFVNDFLHLLGYRSKKLDDYHLVIKNRESASRKKEYKAVLR